MLTKELRQQIKESNLTKGDLYQRHQKVGRNLYQYNQQVSGKIIKKFRR